jgi:arabinofuranosyltransferase
VKATAAKRALGCGELKDLIEAIDEPMTPGRFLENIVRSPSLTRLHIAADPVVAERELCPAPRR